MVWSEELKREIPKGWGVENLMSVCDWVSGAQPPKSTFKYRETDGYIRFIQNRDYADSNNLTFIPISKGNKVCDVFDIMMDKYGDAGQIRYGLEGAYNVALAKVKPKASGIQEYLRGFLGSGSVKKYLFNACMASTRASLNGEILGNLFVAIPDAELLSQYEKFSKTVIRQLLGIKQESAKLAELRDWLLPILMNGQIKVS